MVAEAVGGGGGGVVVGDGGRGGVSWRDTEKVGE